MNDETIEAGCTVTANHGQRWIAAIFMLVLGGASACGTDPAPIPQPLVQPVTQSSSYGLVHAVYKDCGRLGNAVAGYLHTGQPTTLDLAYGNDRQTVLTLAPGEQTDLYIRQLADRVIQDCDAQESARVAAARAAKEAAAAKAKLLKQCLASGGTGLVLQGDGRTYACAYPVKTR